MCAVKYADKSTVFTLGAYPRFKNAYQFKLKTPELFQIAPFYKFYDFIVCNKYI